MPQMCDPNFARTVVLLCKHNDDGAFGLVVNRPLATTGRVIVNTDPPIETERELEVWVGGPVEPQTSWMLVGDYEEQGGRGHICEGLYLSTAPTRLIFGYSGWGPGQLEAELQHSAWLLSDVSADLIFSTPSEHMWETAIRRLGADPAALQMSRGVH